MASWDGQDLTVDHKILGDKLAKKGSDSINSVNILKGDKRYTDGIEYLEEAVEHYIRADADQEAAETALKLAESYETFLYNKKKGNPHEMAKYWELAGDCLDDFNEKKAIDCYHKCAYYQKVNNNYQSAAKTYHLIAQLELKKEHVREALDAYDQAADAFITQSSFVHASKILTEKGEYLAKDASYAEAAACFATIIQKNLQPFENQALGFKSMLAMLTHSAISQELSHVTDHDKYLQTLDEKWLKSYERKCVMKMVEAYKKVPLDLAAFSRAIKDYDIVSTLSTWEVDLLLTVKKVMEGQLSVHGGGQNAYEWIQTSKTADVNADDDEDVQQGIYHRVEHITPTHAEKYAELFQ